MFKPEEIAAIAESALPLYIAETKDVPDTNSFSGAVQQAIIEAQNRPEPPPPPPGPPPKLIKEGYVPPKRIESTLELYSKLPYRFQVFRHVGVDPDNNSPANCSALSLVESVYDFIEQHVGRTVDNPMKELKDMDAAMKFLEAETPFYHSKIIETWQTLRSAILAQHKT